MPIDCPLVITFELASIFFFSSISFLLIICKSNISEEFLETDKSYLVRVSTRDVECELALTYFYSTKISIHLTIFSEIAY